MLRRLPRALARAAPLRAEVAAVQALHSSSRVLPLPDESSLGSRAALVATAFAATSLLSATALAEQAPVATPVAAPKDPADTLKGLASLGDAKEIILYQYEVCPFCNKAREWSRSRRVLCMRRLGSKSPDRGGRTTVAGVPGLPQDPVQGGGSEPADQERNQVERIHQGAPAAAVVAPGASGREAECLPPPPAHPTPAQVPVLVVDGEQLNDSKFIIKALDAKLRSGSGRRNPRLWRPASADAQAEEDKWFRWACLCAPVVAPHIRHTDPRFCRSWVDGRFVHVLTPNIYRTVAEAKQTFNYITDKGNFGFVDRELARWSGVAIMVRATWAGGALTIIAAA